MSNLLSVHKSFYNNEAIVKKMEKIVGDNASSFLTSVCQIVAENSRLQECTPESVLAAATMAATLQLPIQKDLGLAYIVPYGKNAQFQIGYKGFIQLALRSAIIKRISVTAIKSGQIVKNDPLKGFEFDFSVMSEETIGFAAYFSLTTGFEAELYMSVEEVTKHALAYSKSFNRSDSPWKTNFEAMAKKTVLKKLLNTYAPKSIELQQAITLDQTTPINDEFTQVYGDNDNVYTKDELRILKAIETCQTLDDLQDIEEYLTEKTRPSYQFKAQELLNKLNEEDDDHSGN